MKMVHVTVHTDKLSESIDFYRKVLGLEVQRDMRGRGPADIVFMSDGGDDTAVELICDGETGFSGGGISAGFAVSGVDEMREKLVSEGYEATPVVSPGPDVRFFFVTDPNGFKVQLLEWR